MNDSLKGWGGWRDREDEEDVGLRTGAVDVSIPGMKNNILFSVSLRQLIWKNATTAVLVSKSPSAETLSRREWMNLQQERRDKERQPCGKCQKIELYASKLLTTKPQINK